MTGSFFCMIVFRRKVLSVLLTATAFLTVIVLSFTAGRANAQVPVERSKDKAVIGGETYYIHIVRKGETAYSISRAYGITVEQLAHENPAAGAILKEGMSLRIPVRIVGTMPVEQPVPYRHVIHDEGKFIYHILGKGETVYYLSKKYQVTEQEIIDANPGLDITRITLGSEIAIPRRIADVVEKAVSVTKPEGYFHRVTSGETLSSIARDYGITLKELRRANRNIRFPKVGDFILIPGMEAVKREVVTEWEPDTVRNAVDSIDIHPGKPEEPVRFRNLSGSFNMAVLLPFFLSENSRRTVADTLKLPKGKKDPRSTTRPEEWIYPASIEFIEMYEGILLAADTLRSLGLDINIHTYDIKSDTVEITRLIMSDALSGMDLIIGPVYSRNLTIVADYAGKLGIPVVSPVPLFSNSPLDDNPLLFMAGSSLEVAQRAIARKVAEYPDHNIVLIHSTDPEESNDIERFREIISAELHKKDPYELIKIRSLPFYSRSEYGTDSPQRLSRALSVETGNIVVIASESAPVMSESVMEVRNLSRKFDMKVFGYPEMRELSNIDPKFLFDLGMMVYSPYWIDYSNEDVKNFISRFRKRFFTEPSEKSYAWQGYDIAYYFLGGLALYGREFITHPGMLYTDLLHTDFDFRRKGSNDGFENQKLFLIRYSNTYDLEMVPENNAVSLGQAGE